MTYRPANIDSDRLSRAYAGQVPWIDGLIASIPAQEFQKTYPHRGIQSEVGTLIGRFEEMLLHRYGWAERIPEEPLGRHHLTLFQKPNDLSPVNNTDLYAARQKVVSELESAWYGLPPEDKRRWVEAIRQRVFSEGRLHDMEPHEIKSGHYQIKDWQGRGVIDWPQEFGRPREDFIFAVEYGCGLGETAAQRAVHNPNVCYLLTEWAKDSVYYTYSHLSDVSPASPLHNVRVIEDNSISVSEKAIPQHSVDLIIVESPGEYGVFPAWAGDKPFDRIGRWSWKGLRENFREDVLMAASLLKPAGILYLLTEHTLLEDEMFVPLNVLVSPDKGKTPLRLEESQHFRAKISPYPYGYPFVCQAPYDPKDPNVSKYGLYLTGKD